MAHRIYKLTRLTGVKYDEVDSFVIIALSEDEARRIAADDAGDEGPYAWVDDKLTSCTNIGIAYDDADSRAVCRSFNAG